jgi:MFS family permease
VPGRLHYGWWIVLAAVAIEFFGLGFGVFALTASYPYLIEGFGWSRTAVVASMTFVVTTVALLGPVTGVLLDRYPIRRMFIAGSLIQATALATLSAVQTLPQYYAACVLLGVGMSGVTVLPNQVLVARWFRARLGLVNGIITAATVLGGAASPLLVTLLAERAGWRTGFLVLAGLVGTLPPLVVALLVRERPADVGLAPYGDAEPEAAVPAHGSLGAAAREPVLWLLAVALFCGSWPCYAATKHIILYLRGLGVDPMASAATLSWMLLAASAGRLIFGFLWDLAPPRAVLLADYVLLVAGAFLLFAAHDATARVVFVVVFGLGYGGLMPLVPLTVVAWFGRRGMGAVLGCFKLFYDAAAALAPLSTAWFYDQRGSYDFAFTLNAGLPCVALAIVALLVRPPRPQAETLDRAA